MSRTGFVGIALMICVKLPQVLGEAPSGLIAGKQVEPNARLQVGQKLVAYYEKKAYLVEVKKINSNRTLTITWVEAKEDADDVKPDELYYIGDSNQTRRSKSAALPEAYRAYDKNQDGQIGLYEWNRSKLSEFRRLDKNRDGFLTPQELAVTMPPAVAATPVTRKDDATPTPGENEPKAAPSNLIEYNNRPGEVFEFTVTGKSDGGAIWGHESYSTDSHLATAAVHSGVLRNGATGVVSVTILSSADKFIGKNANGVTSLERNEAGPAFTIKAKL
jgi:hypothetical protein